MPDDKKDVKATADETLAASPAAAFGNPPRAAAPAAKQSEAAKPLGAAPAGATPPDDHHKAEPEPEPTYTVVGACSGGHSPGQTGVPRSSFTPNAPFDLTTDKGKKEAEKATDDAINRLISLGAIVPE